MTASAMLSVEAALEFLLSRARPLTETESVHLLNAGQRVLAGELRARLDVPPANNSAMDGYAVRSAEVHADAWLPVSQRIAAGDAPGPLAEGTVARIFTGAPIPAGADAVIMQEQAHADGERVRFSAVAKTGRTSAWRAKISPGMAWCCRRAPSWGQRNWAWRPRWAKPIWMCCARCGWRCCSLATNWPNRARR